MAMQGEDNSIEKTDFGWLVVMSILFFVLMAVVVWRDLHPQWGPVQARFRQLLEQYGKVAEARKFKTGIKQIWVPELNLVDRCVTCHLGYDWGSVLHADVPEPLTPHPNLPYMDKHPFEDFGCTPCHGGQGWATTAEAAHGASKGWDDPMVSPLLAKRYDLTEAELIQMRCNFCHRRDVATPGMGEINLAKQEVKTKGCIVCHRIGTSGGNLAPELTSFGDKNPEMMDFSHVEGRHTLFNWAFEHFMNPSRISPTTIMPNYHFTAPQARALTMLVLSWKRLTYPPQYIPTPIQAPMAGPAAAPASGGPGAHR
jgi:Cytochrome c